MRPAIEIARDVAALARDGWAPGSQPLGRLRSETTATVEEIAHLAGEVERLREAIAELQGPRWAPIPGWLDSWVTYTLAPFEAARGAGEGGR